MAKQIELKVKQNFNDKYDNKTEYKKGKTYPFAEKRAEELLKNPYLVEKVSETEVEEEKEIVEEVNKEEKTKKNNK